MNVRIVPSDPLSRPAIPRPEMHRACREAQGAAFRALGKVQAGPHGCWILRNVPRRDGYVELRTGNRSPKRSGHVVMWELLVGPIPAGLELDHLCRVRRCVNPEHLEPVTPSENVRRSLNGVRQTICSAGHPIAGDNAYMVRTRGYSRCKQCYFADNRRRQKELETCDGCGRQLTKGYIARHRRDSCPAEVAA